MNNQVREAQSSDKFCEKALNISGGYMLKYTKLFSGEVQRVHAISNREVGQRVYEQIRQTQNRIRREARRSERRFRRFSNKRSRYRYSIR